MQLRKLLLTVVLGVALIDATGTKAQASHVKFDYVTKGLLCIHHYEGAWNANTGNGYYGGLQMDYSFQKAYGSEFLRKYGTANNWPIWAQLLAGHRAYYGYHRYKARYFGPWPNTRRLCGI